MTGVTSIAGELAPKRIALLRDLLGPWAALGLLINPDTPLSEAERRDAESAAQAVGQRLDILTARDQAEIDAAFAGLQPRGIAALMIAVDTYYFGQMRRMAALAARHRVPAIGPLRDFAQAGGLMTYAPAGFRSRRGRCNEPTPITPQYASFATYKTPRIQHVAGPGSRSAMERAGVGVRPCDARSLQGSRP